MLSHAMDAFLQDLRYAVRMIVKSPGITAIALLTIGVATGANATVFGFVSALLLRPAPGVVDPGSLVAIYTSDFSSGPYGDSSYPDYESMKAELTTFTGIAAQQANPAGVVQIGDNVERVGVAAVTGEYFELLGVKPTAGRVLRPQDVLPSAPPAVVIGHALWRRTGADSSILGQSLTANGVMYTIVGVLPEKFSGLDLGIPTQVWLPLIPPPATPDARADRGISVVARLRAGKTVREAQTQVEALAKRLAAAFPETNLGTLQARTEPRPMFALKHSRLPPDFRPMVQAVGTILMGAVGLVLVIACANVAGLLVSRALTRDREMAVRLALGAGRSRIVRQLLTESLVLGLGGGFCGLLLALWTADVLPSFFPAEQAQMLDTSVDVRTIAFIAAISIASSLLFGIAPALQASSASTALSHRATSGRTSDGRGGARLRRVLVAGQVAAAVVLLVASGLLVKSLANALEADLGFGTREGVIATAELPSTMPEAQGQQYFASLLERVRGMSGVRAAGLVRDLPLTRSSRRVFRIEGYTPKPNEDMELVINVASEGYFETMQIPLRAGRTFDARDRGSAPAVVIVNDQLANRFFGGDALGKRLTEFSGRPLEIVGVVQSHKYLTVQEPSVATVYYPLAQEHRLRMTLVARVDGAPLSRVDSIRRMMASVDPKIPVDRAMLLSKHFDESVAADRLTASLVALCGGMALLLATLGVYGVIAYAVVRRSREIGIRVALGARAPDVFRLILAEGLGVTSLGVSLGLVAAALTAQGIGSLTPLYRVGATDPLTYAVVPALLLSVALLAALPPARRALRLDPISVLRQE
ncbi:MAG TPA: ABC transporter permease [Vicinamibacterales bacterium]|jgi:predicted permease